MEFLYMLTSHRLCHRIHRQSPNPPTHPAISVIALYRDYRLAASFPKAEQIAAVIFFPGADFQKR